MHRADTDNGEALERALTPGPRPFSAGLNSIQVCSGEIGRTVSQNKPLASRENIPLEKLCVMKPAAGYPDLWPTCIFLFNMGSNDSAQEVFDSVSVRTCIFNLQIYTS